MQEAPRNADHVGRVQATTPLELLALLVHLLVVFISLASPLVLLASTLISEDGFTLEHWGNALADLPRWKTLLGNTTLVCVSALAVCLPLSVLLASLLVKTNVGGRGLGLALLIVTAAFPVYVQQAALLAVLGTEAIRASPIAVGMIHALAHLPLITLAVAMALRSSRKELEESALLEGASSAAVLCRVTLRGALGGIAASGILLILLVTTDYSVSDVLVVRTFAEEVYTQFALHARPEEPTLVSLPQSLLFGVLLWVLLRKLLTSNGETWPREQPLRFSLGSWRTPATLGLAAILISLAAAPVVLLASRLEGLQRLPGYLQVFTQEVGTSLWTSSLAALACSCLGLGLAWHLARRMRFWRVLFLTIVVSLAMPAPTLGIGLITLFNRPGFLGALYDSPFILVIAYTVRFLPVAVILLVPAVRSIPVEMERAAAVDGCSRAGIWRRILFPLCLPSMGVAFFVVAVLSLGELPCSLLVAPPGCSTVAGRFFSMIHYGLYADAAALCLLSVATVLVPCIGLLVLLRKRMGRDR